MVTPVDGNAAAQTLLTYSDIDPGYCLHYVWTAYKENGAQSDGGYYPTAYSAWEASEYQHPGDLNPPAGVPVYLGPRSGSSAGDVMISLGGGQCAATDWPYNGVTGVCTIDQRMDQTNRPYLGWTEDILGYPVAQGQPALTVKDVVMEIVMVVPDGTVVHLAGPVKHNFGSIDEYNRIRDDIEFFRDRGGIDAMPLPALEDVVGVDWDTYQRFCAYFGAPED